MSDGVDSKEDDINHDSTTDEQNCDYESQAGLDRSSGMMNTDVVARLPHSFGCQPISTDCLCRLGGFSGGPPRTGSWLTRAICFNT